MSVSGGPLSDEERLERFESLIDAGLAYLDAEELLVELLDRLRDTLAVDVAVVSLMDESRSHLVTRVVRGIERPSHLEVRTHLGHGFVGRIADEMKAMVLDRRPDGEELDPHVRGSGLATLLGVPLVAQGTVIGVVHVGSVQPREFTEDDIDLLQSAGDRMALAIEARSASAQISAAIMLQRSLVPGRMPPVAGLRVAGRYVPGEGDAVGGDWYDLFTLPSGHVAFAVGDVVGHGLRAAVVMGRLRSALRAYALGSLDPAKVVTQLNRKLRHFERSQMATLLYGVLDPMLDRVHLSSAGHPPAMLAAPGQATVELDVPPDLPLGAFSEAPRRTTTLDVPSGGLLCLYTDGLIERRGEPLDAGLARLRSAFVPGDPDDLCESVMAALIGQAPPKDDVALLVVRREEVETRNVLVLPAERSSLARLRTALRRWLATTGASAVAVGDLLVAIGEAASNSVEHAYGPAGGLVEVSVELSGDAVVATVRDNGSWRPARGEGRGRGILVMKGLSDDVRIDRGPTGTEVTIRRRLRREEDP